MISDEPDEDADNLDDDAAIATLLGEPAANPSLATEMPDWPPGEAHDLGLGLDDQTLAWFRYNYVDWRRQMRSVLRAWVMANTAGHHLVRLTPVRLAPPTDDQA